MFKTIAVIGVGMIGGSVALAARRTRPDVRILGFDMNPDSLAYAHGCGMVDNSDGTDFSQLRDADLVLLAVPMRAYAAVFAAITPHLRKDAVVSDVGSTKRSALRDAAAHLPHHLFIGGHPIAGREQHGPQNARADLFQDRWAVITPTDTTPPDAAAILTRFWESLGSRVAVMDAAHHDRVLAITSHLPQLIARTIVGTAADLEDEVKDEVIKFSAGGFRDFTRMAAADPVMWRDIFLENGDAVLEMLQRLGEDIAMMQKLIRTGDGEAIEAIFARARAVRARVLAAGQA